MTIKPQVAGRCIFCNGFKMSKEHVWSDFLTKRGLIPHQENHTFQQIGLRDATSSNPIIVAPPPRTKPGPLAQTKIRNVCVSCNTGWMQGMVGAVVPIVEPLVRSEAIRLDGNQQSNLANWIAISTIMAEFTDVRTAGIPKDDRVFLMNERRPPDNWTILIGRYSGTAWSPIRYRHHGLDVAASKSFDIAKSNADVSDRQQVSTSVLGGLTIHVMSSTSKGLVSAFRNSLPTEMACIHPFVAEINWQLQPNIDDTRLLDIADSFRDAVIHITRNKLWYTP